MKPSLSKLPEPLAALQARAAAAFARHGLPSPRDEAWHYTQLRQFWPAQRAARSRTDAPPSRLAQQLTPEHALRLTYRGKQFQGASARSPHLQIAPLGDALEHSAGLRAKWGRSARADIGAAMAGLNLAELDAALYVRLEEGAEACLCVDWQGGGQARLVVDVAAGAQLRLSELGEPAAAQNLIVDGWLARAARLAHRKILRARATHIASMRLQLSARAQLDQDVLLLGRRSGAAQLVRHETHLRFQGGGARARLRGYDLAAGRHQSELIFASHHRTPGGAVDMRSRHILWDEARAVFHGQVHIAPHAVATDAQQNARALLRSSAAEMDARPELRIHADDVTCAHGVSIGELDAQALFYLRQRGLSFQAASQLLLETFLMEDAPPADSWGRQDRARFMSLLLGAMRQLERGGVARGSARQDGRG